MAHTRTVRASALVVLLALAVGPGAGCAARRAAALPPPAPEAADRWERVLALTPGAQVRVELQSGAVVEGRLQGADQERVVIHPGLLDGAPRESVKKVALVMRRVREGTWRGIVAGVAVAAVLAVTSAGSSDAKPFAPIAVWFGGIGAAGGALVGLRAIESVVYERLIRDVEVSVADGAVARPGDTVDIAVSHGLRTLRPSRERVGITACISLRRDRCERPTVQSRGPAGRLPSPFAARLRLSDRLTPGAALEIHVHVVVVSGQGWQPGDDEPLPRPGDPGVLAVETTTRRVTVAGD